MKKPFKKLTAWLCCMAMLISFIPATALPVFATDAEPVELTQTEGTLEAGSYKLTGDLTLTGTLTVKGKVTIDLAGNDITGTVYPLIHTSGSSADLTITDSTAAGTPGTNYESGAIVGGDNASTANYGMITAGGGKFILDGGKLTGYNYTGASDRGGAVTVMNTNTVFTMNGGEITGNTCAKNGAGVFLVNNTVFTMNGGAIYDNTATGYGGGVYAGYTATVNIDGGVIRDNTANTAGGGVYTASTASTTDEDGNILTGSVNISGTAVISGNETPKNGGGVYAAGTSIVTMTGGAITGNSATGSASHGGGVCLDGTATFTIEGGTISGNSAYRGGGIAGIDTKKVTVNIAGGTIENNIGSNRGANLYAYDATYNISGGTIGAATSDGTAVVTDYKNAELRGGTMNITGGNIAHLATQKGSAHTTLTISGNPVISRFNVNVNCPTKSIGGLTLGASVTVTTANVLTVTEDGTVAVDATGKVYTYNAPTSDINVTAENGTVTATVDGETVTEATEGDTVTLTVTPDENYEIDAVTATYEDGTVALTDNEDGTYTFEMPGKAVTVTATFTEKVAEIYTVTVTQPEVGGTIEVNVTEGVEGTTVTVTATPATGYELDKIYVDDVAIDGTTFTISGNHVVTATFTEKEPTPLGTGGVTLDMDHTYKLDGDVVATGGWTIKANITIDLMGHTISMPDEDDVYFNIDSTGKLTIKDSVGTGKVQFKETTKGYPGIQVAGTFVLEGGELTGWSRSEAGAMVYLYKDAKFEMTGGKLTDTSAEWGSVIRTSAGGGTVTISGGEISGNTNTAGNATASGAIVLNSGVTMTVSGDAKFNENKATSTASNTGFAGAIFVASGATLNITGGTFSKNTALNGGAIYNAGTLTISGGTFTENTATVNGGAIFNKGTMTMTNGTISGSEAANFGGAICVDASSNTTVSGGSITGNTARRGGGISTCEANYTDTAKQPVVTIDGTAQITGNSSNNAGKTSGYQSGATLNLHTAQLTIGGTAKVGYGTQTNDAGSAEATGTGETYLRSTSVTVTGGTMDDLSLSLENNVNYNITAAISGNPDIAYLLIPTSRNNTGADKTSGTEDDYTTTCTTTFSLASGGSVTAGDSATETVLKNAMDDTVHYTGAGRLFIAAADYEPSITQDSFDENGKLVLTEDSSVAGGVTLAAGVYTLDLAGYTLTGDAAPYFTIGTDVTLTITDSSAAKTGKVQGLTDATNAMIFVNGGTFVLKGGKLTGNINNAGDSNNGRGGAIRVAKNSTVSLIGGEISGNTAFRGGGVATTEDNSETYITFNIGGNVVIKDNTATSNGANIYVYGVNVAKNNKVAIFGGTIGGGTVGTAAATYSNNVCLRAATVEVTGGTITHLYVYYAGTGNSDLTISGAPRIEKLYFKVNKADGYTGGTATIGSLSTGARVATETNNELTVLDDGTVNAQAKLYRYAEDVETILFVANSFGADTKTYLAELGEFFGHEIDAVNMYIGSQNIRNHAQSLAESLRNTDLNGDGVTGDSRQRVGDGLYDIGDGKGAIYDIPTVVNMKDWNYVVLQPGVEYVGFEGTYNSDINFLMDYIKAVQPATKILWSQTWAMDNLRENDTKDGLVEGSSYLTQFGDQAAMYDAILRNTNKFISGNNRFGFDGWFPIGIAVQEMREGYTDTSSLDNYLATRLTRDGYHLSYKAGRMIAGLTVMKTLYGDDIDLNDLTAEDMIAMFNNSDDHLADQFDPSTENVEKLRTAVETACANKATIAADCGTGTANKQFNPDAAQADTAGEFVAVYENVTECGQAPVRIEDGNGVAGVLTDKYASTGAGKIVIYQGNTVLSQIDELWLENNDVVTLTNRYDVIKAAVEAESTPSYYIQADPQAPQLAAIGDNLYLTFDVMVYTDDGKVGEYDAPTSLGVCVATSADKGKTWTKLALIDSAAQSYGLTALTNGDLLLSVIDGTGNTDVLTLTTATGTVSKTVQLVAASGVPVYAAFAEVNGTVWALASNGTVHFSTDNGANWTTTGIDAGGMTSPDLVPLSTKGMYVTWADTTEKAGKKVYSKVWTVDSDDTTTYGWGNTEASVVAECDDPTAYAGAILTIAEPATFVTGINSDSVSVKTYYTSGGKYISDTHEVLTVFGKQLALESNPIIRFMYYKDRINAVGGDTIEFVRTYSDDKANVELEYKVNSDLESGSYYQVLYNGITAKEMGDDVYLTIYNDEGRQVAMLEKTSVQTELVKILNKATSSANPEELKVLAVDMLNYGAAAQTHFGYDAENLVNANLTVEQAELASADLAVDADGLAALKEGYVTAKTQVAKSPYLQNAIEVHLEYTKSDANYGAMVAGAAYATADYTTHSGTVVTGKELEVTDGHVTNSTLLSMNVVLNFLAAADMRTPVTVKLYDADGNVIEGTEITYTIATYAASSQALGNGYDKTNALDVLVMRMVQYGDSAYAYFHRNDA